MIKSNVWYWTSESRCKTLPRVTCSWSGSVVVYTCIITPIMFQVQIFQIKQKRKNCLQHLWAHVEVSVVSAVPLCLFHAVINNYNSQAINLHPIKAVSHYCLQGIAIFQPSSLLCTDNENSSIHTLHLTKQKFSDSLFNSMQVKIKLILTLKQFQFSHYFFMNLPDCIILTLMEFSKCMQ